MNYVSLRRGRSRVMNGVRCTSSYESVLALYKLLYSSDNLEILDANSGFVKRESLSKGGSQSQFRFYITVKCPEVPDKREYLKSSVSDCN